jgi:hypothetical protein
MPPRKIDEHIFQARMPRREPCQIEPFALQALEKRGDGDVRRADRQRIRVFLAAHRRDSGQSPQIGVGERGAIVERKFNQMFAAQMGN